MNILFCNYEYPPLGGGGGVVNAALACELARSHSVTVLTSRAFDLPSESLDHGVRILRAPVLFRRRLAAANFPSMAAYLFTAAGRGRRLLRRERFDVINTHFALPTGPVGHFLGRFAGIPNVLSVHGGDLYDPSKRSSAHRHRILRFCVRRLALGAQAVVAQSNDTLANLQRFFAPEIDATVIPLGIPRPPAAHASRAGLGFCAGDKLLITVGRLVGRKAVDQLIDVVAELRDRSVKLLVVGSGPLSGELEQRARQRLVASQVRFMGQVTEQEKFELLSVADLYVSTSQHEGFGLVFLEAMAAGLPVLCYGNGGHNDFLQHGKSGRIAALNDRDSLVAHCRDLLRQPELRASLGSSNRRAVEHFYIEHCAQRYEALFETVIRRRAGGDQRIDVCRSAVPVQSDDNSAVASRRDRTGSGRRGAIRM